MTIHQENEQSTSGSNLLTPQEQALCKQIAAHEAPHSQRAMALLALNERSTQAQAAEQAGLSIGQVKYWITKFRKQRLGIFPDTLLDELDVEAEVELVTEIEEEPESVTEKADSAEDKTKDTKAKKGKKAKQKTKKAKKDKKGRRAKKTEKKTVKVKKNKKRKGAKKTKKAKTNKKGKKTKKTKKKPT
jgi:hypothetical protein